MQQRDYIQRLIEQLAATVASILGLTKVGKEVEADRALDEAWVANLGMRRADAERLDDATLRLMLREKVALAAMLFDAQAQLEQARGVPDRAVSLRARALRLGR